jgi:hypothetical protein
VSPAAPGAVAGARREGAVRARGVTAGFGVGLIVVAVGFHLGARPMHDNSFLTHLATGRLILDTGGIPRHDPYSFTAPGHDWTVQSWLASLLYGLADRVGDHALLALHGAVAALLAAFLWRLTAPAPGLVTRMAAVAPTLVAGAALWAERPFMVGLVCLAATALVLEDERAHPAWLLPVGWVWVNSHGSFPYGVGLLLLAWVGRRLDRRDTVRVRRLAAWAAGGLALGALNPLGPRLLAFPLTAVRRRDQFRSIVEWASPSFADLGPAVTLVALLAALVLVVRRPSWERALVVAAFTALACVAQRNLAVAGVVVVPALAHGLGGWGQLRAGARGRLGRLATAAGLSAAALAVAGAATGPAWRLDAYPVAELAWMRARGLLHGRVATQDFVGNYRTLTEGPHGQVFVDDRYDMYPERVAGDYTALLRGRPSWKRVLDRWRIDAVLWQRDTPLASLLAESEGWRTVRRTKSWVVAVRA